MTHPLEQLRDDALREIESATDEQVLETAGEGSSLGMVELGTSAIVRGGRAGTLGRSMERWLRAEATLIPTPTRQPP